MPSRKSDSRSFRFELQPNGAAGYGHGRSSGRGGAGAGRSKGDRGGFSSKQAVRLRDDEGGDWLKMDVDDVCSLVPHMPRAVVLTHTNRERARGASVEEAIDSLLALCASQPAVSQSAEALPSGMAGGPRPSDSPPATASITAASVAAATAITSIGTVVAAEVLPLIAAAEVLPSIAELPDEVLSSILLQLGQPQAGRLGCVSRDCRAAVAHYFGAMRILRVEGPKRKWADDRILGLVRMTSGLEQLWLDCAPRGNHGTAEGAAAGSRQLSPSQLRLSEYGARLLTESCLGSCGGFGSLDALLRLPVMAALRSLWLKDATRLMEAHAFALVHSCPQLTSLGLIGCAGLTDRAALHLAGLPQLAELSLARNPQLSSRALQALASAATCLATLDLAHCGASPFTDPWADPPPARGASKSAARAAANAAAPISPPPRAPLPVASPPGTVEAAKAEAAAAAEAAEVAKAVAAVAATAAKDAAGAAAAVAQELSVAASAASAASMAAVPPPPPAPPIDPRAAAAAAAIARAEAAARSVAEEATPTRSVATDGAGEANDEAAAPAVAEAVAQAAAAAETRNEAEANAAAAEAKAEVARAAAVAAKQAAATATAAANEAAAALASALAASVGTEDDAAEELAEELESRLRRVCARADGWGSTRSTSLVSLTLSGWGRSLPTLRLDSASLPRLTHLTLGQAEALAALELRLPSLQRLAAPKCEQLQTATLECPALDDVHLAQCKSLFELRVVGPTSLRSASLFGCRVLGREALQSLLESARGAVRSLDVNGALGTFELGEEDLRRLCPRLDHLDARGRTRKY